MLYLDVQRVLSLRGMGEARKFLMANGFSSNIAFRILHQFDSTIKFEYLEKICLLLHCTPNDLMSWKPNDGNADPNQPLSALDHDTQDVLSSLKNAPIEKLNLFRQWMAAQDQKPAVPNK